MLFIFFGFGIYIAVDTFVRSGDEQSAVGDVSGSVQASTINVFRTQFFQFQADKKWQEVIDSSGTNDRFVYRSFDSTLLQQELIVEVDTIRKVPLDNEQTSRVLPIEIKNNRMVTVDAISPHCERLLDESLRNDQQTVTYRNADFPCNPDSSVFMVAVALVGGNNIIPYNDANDVPREIKITYRDSSFTPTGSQLDNIINTFQLF